MRMAEDEVFYSATDYCTSRVTVKTQKNESSEILCAVHSNDHHLLLTQMQLWMHIQLI